MIYFSFFQNILLFSFLIEINELYSDNDQKIQLKSFKITQDMVIFIRYFLQRN